MKNQNKKNQTRFICPACFGNGYRKITQEACNNQGETVNNEKNIHALRYINHMF